jgi:hypothetical protein
MEDSPIVTATLVVATRVILVLSAAAFFDLARNTPI